MKNANNMITKYILLVFQKHHNFTCWLAMNEKCKQYDNKIYSLGLSKTSQFYMLIGNEWKMQTNMKTKLTLLVFQKHHNFTCWLAINENANNMITKFTLVGLSKTSQFYMLIGNEWKMQTNMKTKLTSLRLSKTSQFYMLIGNEWKMQTIW